MKSAMIATSTVYVITDIEADGPDPGTHSMLGWASVAQAATGKEVGHFTANIAPLDGAQVDPGTMAWWKSQPQAWLEVTRDQRPPEAAVMDFIAWVRTLSDTVVFVAHPLSFDGAWIDWYLQRFAGVRLFDRSRDPGLLHGFGIDLPSLVMGTMGWDYRRCRREYYPEAWLGGYHHSHCALDDARGYAALFRTMCAARSYREAV